jgi:acetylornithine/succinyldiaminopimelate/putrescine aminotransferase/predicted amino acid dehydrogenase/acyl-coenzyme A synthetase/AMP-(fatty) acid ligase
MEKYFDLVFQNSLDKGNLPHKSVGNILFDDLPGRNDDSKIILSHFEHQYIEIKLGHLRSIICKLICSFDEKKITKGQTVILLTFQGCNEMLTAIFFIALAVKGCRTFLPMYSESEEFSEWIDITHTEHIIIPDSEVKSLEGHDIEKYKINEIRTLAARKNIGIWDNILDFDILEALFDTKFRSYPEKIDITELLRSVSSDDEALIVTTSGSSGRSKLVVYTHEAYYLNCLAWQQAGFYDQNLLGGSGFTPMITHTMGIRALMNALWTGSPVCLIITEWFMTKPETVRYLLLKMKPEHITGGPAVYNTFLEFFRRFPEIKTLLSKNLKTLISSGAKYDPVTAGEVTNATGLHLHNALGTTETQQVFSTLLSPESVFDQNLMPLGKPLPGVSVGLFKSDQGRNHFRLNIKSAFGYKYCIGEEATNNHEYFDTGDIVFLDENNCFYYVRLANRDYFKDSFGVKIPVNIIRKYYNSLLSSVLHAEFYSVTNSPGLALLMFIRDNSLPPGLVTGNGILTKFKCIVEELNIRLINYIEPFEFQHRHICRIALLNQLPPRTGKGTISVKQINVDNRELIDRLTDIRKDISGIETTDKHYQSIDKYTRYISPKIGTLMSSIKLNYCYHRCEKDTLFTYIHGKEVEILDVTGGYGTNLLGYNNPKICNAVKDFISSGKIAICNQLSVQSQAGHLAEKLNLSFGSETGRSYQVVFGNSGSEAVEIAIHHAFFEWEKRIEKIKDQQVQMFGSIKSIDVMDIWNRNTVIINKSQIRIIALVNSFHGHTTGARSLLGNTKKRLKFSQMVDIEPVFIDERSEDRLQLIKTAIDESLISLERIVQVDGEIKIVPFAFSTIIAAIAEPIQGEGGVHEVNKEFLKELSLNEFPLISDEIQCGLGRTGDLPECKYAHYYLLGKALGGGLEKISAVLIDKSRYCDDFCEYYASTFGNGELSATAGITAVEQIKSSSLLQKVRETGSYLQGRLTELFRKYPSVILDVQGKGLMLAVYFNPECMSGDIFLRILFETEKAGYLLSAWLLNRHHIRMLPSLSAPFTLRLEPSAYFTEKESDKVFEALDELCSIIRNKKVYDLFSFLMDDDTFIELSEASSVKDFYKQILEKPEPDAVNVAFIAHFVFPLRELKMLEPDFSRASDTGLRILFNRFQTLLEMDPVKLIAINLFHGKVHFTFYIIPVDSSELEFLHKSGRRKKIVTKIQKAVNISVKNGAEIISLGGYTSILTNNGLSLYEPANSKIITGNTLTAASGLIHLRNTIKQAPEFNKPNIIAIVGSTGNIGQVITEILCEQKDICSELLLVSRCEKRMIEFINELGMRKKDSVKISCSNNINDIKIADIIVICSNTNDPIVFPYHIATYKPVLISDLSVPSAVSSDVNNLPNVKTLPFSAYVTLPEDENAVISSYSPPGTVFCCAAEAILLGLEKFDGSLKGKVLPEEVRELTELAQKHNMFKNTGNMDSFKTSRI